MEHDLLPPWEHKFPGRFDWEIRALESKATRLSKEVKHGILQVDFDWPVGEGRVNLRAIYPTAFPYLRPHVLLLNNPADWPDRHVAPTDGNVCLLGRDTAQWRPNDTLADLLDLQLESALRGTGSEDPQGEPAEVWWNGLGKLGNYCLIDSEWDLHSAEGGTLVLRVAVDRVADDPRQPNLFSPRIRIAVTAVRNERGEEIASWTAALPADLLTGKVCYAPWKRLDSILLPKGNPALVLQQARQAGSGKSNTTSAIGHGLGARIFAFIHPTELTEKEVGDGWIVGMDVGPIRHFNQRGNKQVAMQVIPIYRAGKRDIGERVPAVGVLTGKRIALIGTGALGAPIAIELARNGVSELRLLDHDQVEPGNSIRWPLGAAAWGKHKVLALKQHVEQHYPGCLVVPFVHQLGGPQDVQTDDEALEKVLRGADLLIDASASHGINRLLWDHCQRIELPLVRLGATPNVTGGTVVLHTPDGGCPVCLQYHREEAHPSIPSPPGADSVDLIQPPGCGERTFRGAGYDLQELSLQAIRVAVGALSVDKTKLESMVYTLTMRDSCGAIIPPAWETSAFPPHSQCPCMHERNQHEHAHSADEQEAPQPV